MATRIWSAGLTVLISEFLYFFSRKVLYLLGFGLIGASLVFMAGGSLENIGLIVAINVLTIFAIVTEYVRIHHYSYKRVMTFLLFSYLLTVACTVFVTFIYDKSWDGMAYHQITIMKLYEGWNPVYEELVAIPMQSKYYSYKVTLINYVNHYPKAHEILATLFLVTTNKIESGKVINLLLLIASFGAVFSLVTKLGMKPGLGILISLAAAFNPIALNQVFSYYLDGAIGSLILIFLSQLILFCITAREKENFSVMAGLFVLILILCNIKFTAFAYTVLFCALFTIFLLVYKDYHLLRRFLFVGLGSGIIAVFVVGYNPYVKNTAGFGHPLHPLAGKHKEDIITPYLPPELAESNSTEKFLTSTFSESANFDSRTLGRKIKLKLPFTFTITEIKAFQSEGVRLGGFGVFWSGIFLISILATPLAIYVAKNRDRYWLMAVLLALLMSVLINPESWWARFIPQLWLYPAILIFVLFRYGDKRIVLAARGITLLLILNSMLVGAVSFSSTIKNTLFINKEFEKLKKLEKPILVYLDIFSPNARRLNENKIPFESVEKLSELPCDSPLAVSKFDYCLP